jgi:putative transposase
MHDRDTKFTKSFDAQFTSGTKNVKISAFRAPNTNAFVERFIQSIKQECLDHFVLLGQGHFNHLCAVSMPFIIIRNALSKVLTTH